MDKNSISALPWRLVKNAQSCQQHDLFNSKVMARALSIESNEPFCLVINTRHYLAYKRHAGCVIGGLALSDILLLQTNIELLRDVLLPMGIKAVSLNSFNAVNDQPMLANLLTHNAQIRFEFLLDTRDYSPSKISSNHKRNIKKSQKNGATAQLAYGLSATQAHIALVNTNLLGKGIGGISNSAEYFHFLIEQKAGLLMQVVANGQLLASTFFFINQEFAYYHSAGASGMGKQLGAAHFLVAGMIRYMQTQHIHYLNFGGCTAQQSGLWRFKMGFKPETRVLLCARLRLMSTWQHKVRALLSIKPADVLSFTGIKIFLKQSVAHDYCAKFSLQRLSFSSLFTWLPADPELSQLLVMLCRSKAGCYGLFDHKGKLLGAGFIATQAQNPSSKDSKYSLSNDVAEISHLYVLKQSRGKGLGKTLVVRLEQEALKMGFNKLYARVSGSDVASQKIFNALDFVCKGEEKLLSTRLLGGQNYTLGSVDL